MFINYYSARGRACEAHSSLLGDDNNTGAKKRILIQLPEKEYKGCECATDISGVTN